MTPVVVAQAPRGRRMTVENVVVMFSSGASSWAAAKRAADRYGSNVCTLLFADTNVEDEDNYRFLTEAAGNVGAELVVLDNDGQTIWDVFRTHRFLGNTRADVCSRVLKREPLRRWLKTNRDPTDTLVVLGFDWEETHRHTRAQRHWEPWRIWSPMTEAPYMSKAEILGWLRDEGVEPPRLYAELFAHSNCGGGCVKAGQSQFQHLLRVRPDEYRKWETEEESLRGLLGDVAILRDRTGGTTTPLPLAEFRRRLQTQPSLFDPADGGACSCFDEGPA